MIFFRHESRRHNATVTIWLPQGHRGSPGTCLYAAAGFTVLSIHLNQGHFHWKLSGFWALCHDQNHDQNQNSAAVASVFQTQKVFRPIFKYSLLQGAQKERRKISAHIFVLKCFYLCLILALELVKVHVLISDNIFKCRHWIHCGWPPAVPSFTIRWQACSVKNTTLAWPSQNDNFPWHRGNNGKLFIKAFTWAVEAVWELGRSGCHC